MYTRPESKTLPTTVEEAAERLFGDMRNSERLNLLALSDEEFEKFYRAVAPVILTEFRIWTGNQALLNACIESSEHPDRKLEPALIILERVRRMVLETFGY